MLWWRARSWRTARAVGGGERASERRRGSAGCGERRWERGVTVHFCDILSLLINMLSSLFVVCVLRVWVSSTLLSFGSCETVYGPFGRHSYNTRTIRPSH